MKKHLPLAGIFGIIIYIITGCNKPIDEPVDQVPPTPTNGHQLVRFKRGTNPATDTVYLVTYNASGKIERITDSTHQVWIQATYDASGRLTDATSLIGYSVHYSYNEGGLLTTIIRRNRTARDSSVLVYNNGVVAQLNNYSEIFEGQGLTLSRRYDYTVTEGNITNVKRYFASGELQSDDDYEYSLLPNPFKELSLLNVLGTLGSGQLFSPEIYLNKNAQDSYQYDTYSGSNEYDYSDDGDIASVESSRVTDNEYNLDTWRFTFK